MPIDSHTLNQLIEALKEHPDAVFATPEDANYFRNAKRKMQNAKPKEEVSENAERRTLKAEVKKEEASGNAKCKMQNAKPKEEEAKAALKEEPVRVRVDLSSVRAVLASVAPELAILEEIPSDGMARKISERWKTKNQTAPISVLSYQEPAGQRELLEGVATALDVCFGPARLVNAEAIEKEKQWEMFLGVEGLKMIVVCDYSLWQLGGLMKFYRETPAQGVRMLGNVPIFLLPDLSLYLKDPLLKRSLWKALCQKFS